MPEPIKDRTMRKLIRLTPTELGYIETAATRHGMSENSAACLLLTLGAAIELPASELEYARQTAAALGVDLGTAVGILIARGRGAEHPGTQKPPRTPPPVGPTLFTEPGE